MADFDIVIEKLHGFETADDIANYFRDYGIKAMPGSARSCAISKFVKEETNLPLVITSGSVRGVIDEEHYSRTSETAYSGALTYAMKYFIINFDNLLYIDLIG